MSINFIVPVGSMSLSDQKEYRKRAIIAGIKRAIEKKIGDVSDLQAFLQNPETYLPQSIDVRELQPIQDAGAALDQWNTAALAAVGTTYSVFQAAATVAMPTNKLIVFYGIGCETVPLPVSRLEFRIRAITGNMQAVFDLEQLVNRMETVGFFSTPVIWDPGVTYAAQVMARIATGVLARVQLGAFVFESGGNTTA